MDAPMKTLFRGVFNFNKEVYIKYAYAYTCKQAWLIMCRQIAKKQGVLPRMVMNYFNGEKDNFKITIEVEFKETKC